MHGGDIYRNRVKIDFSVNVNPLGIPDAVKRALADALGRCGEYPDIRAEELKRAAGGALGVPENSLLFGNGSSELLMAAARAIGPKRTVIPVPSFYGYEHAANALEGTVFYCPTDARTGFLPDERLAEALTKDTDLLFLANPVNPSGALAGRETLKTFLELCRKNGIFVILDESFIDFCGDGFSMLPETARFDNLILIRSYTKIFSIPGVRLGYLVCGDRSLLARIEGQLPEWNVSVFAQRAGIACAGQSAFVEKTVVYVKKERRFLAEHLERAGFFVFPGEADFILFYSEKPLYEGLLARGILIRDCSDIRGLGKGYYRVAVRKREDNEMLLRAIGECVEKD